MLLLTINVDGVPAHSVSRAGDVGVGYPCLPSTDYPVPFRAQQSSRQGEGKEHVGVRGRGHLEAAGLE